LANIDGQPGAEVVSFSSDASRVVAMDVQGRPLDGWPISASVLDAKLRMLVADLEGNLSFDRDLELVLLTKRRVEVVGLGPGSYDQRSTPWPLVHHDPAARGTHPFPRADQDPLRLGTTLQR
jgi:hypothetical protein